MKTFKYIVQTGIIYNCPTCEGTSPSGLRFYKNLKDLLNDALQSSECRSPKTYDPFWNGYEFERIYSYKTGKELENISFSYENSRHNCHGITVKIRNLKFRTKDDGHGTKIWTRDE
jgi:hypothetical protein